MNQRKTLLLAGASGCVAVMLGAFGAHGLKEMLTTTGRIDTYELAVQYQFYHTMASLLAGILMGQFDSRFLRYSSLCFFIGILFFSGSLYLFAFTGKMIGVITPIGGVFFILGWIFLIVGIYKNKAR